MYMRRFLASRDEPKPLVTVTQETTVREYVKLLCQCEIGAAPVVSSDGDLVGIVSQRDILREWCSDRPDLDTRPLGDIMTREVVTGSPEDEMHEVLRRMTRAHIRHLPILEDGKGTAIVTVGDILRALFVEDELKIHELRDFLGGTFAPEAQR